MSAERDDRDYAIYVAVEIGERAYHVGYDAGRPRGVRRVLPNGEPCAWWLLTSLPGDSEYGQAARRAEAFLAQFRSWAS
jgi:hypothetical protein